MGEVNRVPPVADEIDSPGHIGALLSVGGFRSPMSWLVAAVLTLVQPYIAVCQTYDVASSQTILATHAINGRPTVDLLLLTKDKKGFGVVLKQLQEDKADIKYQNAELGYFRVRARVDYALALTRNDQIDRFLIAQESSADSPYGSNLEINFSRLILPDAKEAKRRMEIDDLRAGAPELAVSSIGLAEFQSLHPSFDGRGTEVAIIEGVGVLDHPALQDDGRGNGRKIVRILSPHYYGPSPCRTEGNVANRLYDSRESGGVQVLTDKTGQFSAFGRTFTLPESGSFCAVEVELRKGGFLPPAGLRVAIVWRRGRHNAWVDVNGDGDLSHVAPTEDFNRGGKLVHIPTLRPSWENKNGVVYTYETPSLPVAMVFDDAGIPRLFGNEGHATMTSSLAAARLFSAAPEAGIVFVPANSLATALEGVIQAAQDSEIGSISASIGYAQHMPTGQSFDAVLLDRVIRLYRKPVFWAAGDDPSEMGTVESQSAASRVMSVGAYEAGETIEKLSGQNPPQRDYVGESSWGPSALGGMKPNLLAPALGLAPIPCDAGPGLSEEGAVQPPRCYGITYATSAATPIAAGAALALISGASQLNVPHDANRVSWALMAGARYLPSWPAAAQGAGLLRLPEAWDLLFRARTVPEWRVSPDIKISAPISTPLCHSPSAGNGLYESEGWTQGDSGTRNITLVRRDGPDEPIIYDIELVADDKTFSLTGGSPNHITLRRDQPAQLHVSINAMEFGLHSAQLRLIDPQLKAPVIWISMVVIVAHRLNPDNHFAQSSTFTHNELLVPSMHFVDVPDGTQVLRAQAANLEHRFEADVIPEPGSSLHLLWRLPNSTYAPPFLGDASWNSGRVSRSYPSPPYGTWQFVAWKRSLIDSKFTQETDHLDFIALAADVRGSVAPGKVGPQTVDVTSENRMGDLLSAKATLELGAMTERRIKNTSVKGMPTVSQFYVNPGTKTLRVDVRPIAGSAEYRPLLFDCTGKHEEGCDLWELPLISKQTYTIRNPSAGPWRIVVQDWKSMSQASPYVLRVIQTGERYGTVEDKAEPKPRGSGEKWSQQFLVRTAPIPFPPSATSVALIEVRDYGQEEAERNNLKDLTGEVPQRPVAVGESIVMLRRISESERRADK